MTPAERLRTELQRLRARGYRFKTAWPVAMSVALRDESIASSVWWRQVFNEQREKWACAYSKVAWPANQGPALDVTLADADFSGPAARTRQDLVVA